MAGPETWACQTCGNLGLSDGADGFYYCLRCGSQADDVIDTGVADEDLAVRDGDVGGQLYSASHTRRRGTTVIKAEPISQFTDSQSQFWDTPNLTADFGSVRPRTKQEDDCGPSDGGVGPTGPEDFGSLGHGVGAPSFEDYSNEVRMRYVMGLQLMIESQCEVLVREFKVTPLICGLAATVWLRLVASTRVFEDSWDYQAIQDSESQHEGDPEDVKLPARHRAEPHNLYGQRAVMIWFRYLRKRLPLSCTLAVSFLTCHIAREAVLPTDIEKWSLEGKLPYYSAFLEIEKRIGQTSGSCPISARSMFRPSQVLPVQKLESLAASIAQTIGLSLPPVNFFAIVTRFLDILSLPHCKILPHARRIYEWSMPPNMWLSANELKLPTRVCVMSILIVAIRILYNLHGFGEWEKSLSENCPSSFSSNTNSQSNHTCDSRPGSAAANGSASPDSQDNLVMGSERKASSAPESEMDAGELLGKLEARYHEIADSYEYAQDLPTYLKYCKDVVFAGLEPSFEDHEEEKLIAQLWDHYCKYKDSEPAVEADGKSDAVGFDASTSKEAKKIRDDGCVNSPSSVEETSETDDFRHSSPTSNDDGNSLSSDKASAETFKEEAIRRLKLDMEENRFCYIPPRVRPKRFDYVHYMRKVDEGAYTFAAQADYYILLRACARAAQVDIRIMHIGVLSFEKRLSWLEKIIEGSLHLTLPTISCRFCSNEEQENAAADSAGVAEVNE